MAARASTAQIREILWAERQQHVIPLLTEDSPAVSQLAQADIAGLRVRLTAAINSASISPAERSVTPFPRVERWSAMTTEARESLFEEGCKLIASGSVAVLLLAGGQGTRLGSPGPKGCYDIGMPSHKSLFQYHAEKMLRVRQLAAKAGKVEPAAVRLPLLVMTSAATHMETVAFFERHGSFGLPTEDVHFFQQGMLPCLSTGGDILVEGAGRVAMAPDGNGGVYRALRDAQLLDMLESQGVNSIFQFCVDNVMCHVADPAFLAFCVRERADCASKVVPKAHAHEKVGVLGHQDGKPCVLEYSEIDKATAEAVDLTTGNLLFGAAHICVNWFSLPFVRRVASDPACTLPLHVARKKIPAVDPAKGMQPGATQVPVDGIKLEMFIFDAFRLAHNMVAYEVPRAEEFAPVKNAPGCSVDSPDTAREIMSEWARGKLRAAGAIIHDGSPVEISPLVSYDGEGLRDLVNGKELTPPVELR